MTTETWLPGDAELYEALAAVQAELPPVPKNKTADAGSYTYKYADLADINDAVMPLLGKNGLAFMAFPGHRDSDGKFGLAYWLVHKSGACLGGWFQIDDTGGMQKVGGRITYARRYCLSAVTGVAAEEDTDAREPEPAPAQRNPRGRPPERAARNLPVNRDGSTARSRVTDDELAATGQMTDAQLRAHNKLERDVKGTGPQGTERLHQADPDDPWQLPEHNHPTGPDDPTPLHGTCPGCDAGAPRTALRVPPPARPKAAAIHMHFARLGREEPFTDQERYDIMTAITGRRIGSTNDLTAAEGIDVGKFLGACRDRGALIERLAVKAGESMDT